MTKQFTYFGLSVLVASFVGACTDGRGSSQLQLAPAANLPATRLVASTMVQFKDPATGQVEITNADTLLINGGSLFMTGKPMGFARLEIMQDQENPSITFSMRSQIPTFSPMGKWIEDFYASGALAVSNQIAFMSGSVGTSVVSMVDTMHPVEVQRYPALNPANPDAVPSDAAYIYSAMVAHPTKPLLYGFTRQDYVYTSDLSAGKLTLIAKDAYGASAGQGVCCAMGAAAFNNQIYVGFRNRLVIFQIGSDGRLARLGESTALNATNVVATSRYLYVQHDPTYSSTTTGQPVLPQGIYVFNTSGANVAFIAAGNPKKFTVSPDDSHFYSNLDGQSVLPYRIQWTN
jgi:hypothetical protein